MHKQNTQPVQTAPAQIAYFSAPNKIKHNKKIKKVETKNEKHLKLSKKIQKLEDI